MTKEEQIDWLCRLRVNLNNGVIFTPWNKEFTEVLTNILEQGQSGDAKNSDWIPVSERLPGKDICEAPGPVWKRKVLITGHYRWNSKENAFITTAPARDVRDGCINKDINVIAWMPYPEIYKESEE